MTMTSRTVEFNWIGLQVKVRSDSSFLTTQIGRLWGDTVSIAPDPSRPPVTFRLMMDAPGGPRYESPTRTIALDPKAPEMHGYNLLIADLFGQVDGHFVLHATTVCRNGRALVVSGPSTFGKTTLGLQLAGAGFDLLADDVTLVDRSNGEILPFNRPFRLRPGTRELLDPQQLAQAQASTQAIVRDEWAVEPDAWIKPAQKPCPASMVTVIRPREDGSALRKFPYLDLRVVRDALHLLDDVRRIDGVAAVREDDADPSHVIVEITESLPLRRWLELNQDSIIHAIKLPAGQASFEHEPRLEKISVFQAAIELCQEMQNRHDGSRLAKEFHHDELALVGELATTIRHARCYALSPGPVKETVALLETHFEKAAP